MLRVRDTGTRGIVREFRFRYKSKRQTGVITLGNFPGPSLADARARAQRFRDLLQEGIDPRRAMNRPVPRAIVDVPVPGDSHSVAALILDFTQRHLRTQRRRPEYAERILQKELADWAHRDACHHQAPVSVRSARGHRRPHCSGREARNGRGSAPSTIASSARSSSASMK